MNKKIMALLIAVVMVVLTLGLAGCGISKKPEADETTTTGEATETTANTDKKVFTMGIDAEYPPFSYMDDNGEYTGFDVEICKAACERLGWEFEVLGVNWDEKLVQLDSGECDCVWSGMTILPSMTEAGYVISEPYYDNTQVILVKDGSAIKTSEDLKGKTVAVQLGTSGEALLADDGDLADLSATFGELVTCDSFLKCFTELEGNGVDAVFVDAPVAKAYAAEHEGYRIIDEELGAEQYGIAFRADDQADCDAISGAVNSLVEDGTYAKIAEKYPDIVNNLLFLNK